MRRLLFLVVFAVLLAGCEKQDYTKVAETEGIYVDYADLVYQVQLSRFLNPADIEDHSYLTGLPKLTEPIGGDAVWFGVWMRVKNYTDVTQSPTSAFRIVDTEGNEFHPIPQDATVNPFVYAPKPIPGRGGLLPPAGSAAAYGPIQGSLILFRIPVESLQNRPLELHIGRGPDEATVALDL